jgi:glycine dehydrogenase subunit 1
MRFAPHTEPDVLEMLAACGLSSLDDLFSHLPRGVRLERDLDIPVGLSEMELADEMRRLAGRNRHADDFVCFAGGGAYDHYVPAVVWVVHAISARAVSGHPPVPIRVSVDGR